jgi:hypothetical protein
MGRRVAVVGLLMMLVACGIGGWVAARPSLMLYVVPGARNVEMTAQGLATWQISYHAPGSPTTWYTDVAHHLESQHWSSPDRVEYGSLSRTYSHAVSLGICELWEWAFLTLDPLAPHIAQIKVRRWIAIPWWRGQQLINNSQLFRPTRFVPAQSAARPPRQPLVARSRRAALPGLL